MGIALKGAPLVETAIAINMIFDIIDRFEQKHGVTITPENLSQYADERKAVREKYNAAMGIEGYIGAPE